MPRKEKGSRFREANYDIEARSEHNSRTIESAPSSINGTPIFVEDATHSIGDFDVWAGSGPSEMWFSFTEPPDAYALYLPLIRNPAATRTEPAIICVPGKDVTCDLPKLEANLLQEERSHLGITFGREIPARYLTEIIGAPVAPSFDLFDEVGMGRGDDRIVAMTRLLWTDLLVNPEEAVTSRSNEMLLRAIVLKLLETVPHKYSDMLRNRLSPAMPRHVRLAIDFMAEHLSMPLTIENISQAAGVSVRSLQIAFQQFKDTTPLTYFRQMRLERARLDLTVASKETELVGAVAKRWGFFNTGRFSAVYAKAFGESPSQTLERRS